MAGIGWSPDTGDRQRLLTEPSAGVRVAVVMPVGEQRGGAEVMLRDFVARSADLQCDVEVVFLEDGPLVNEVGRAGAAVSVVEAGRLRQAQRYARCVRAMTERLRASGPDVVVGWMAKAHLYAAPAGWRLGIPTVWYQLGIPAPPGLLDRLATLLPAEVVIAVSEATGAAQAEQRPRRAIRVVQPGVDLERFDHARLPTPRDARLRLGLPADGPIIGTVGRLQRWKGMHVLIEALPRILAQHPDAHCVIVGGEHALERDYPQLLQETSQALEITDRVIFAGLQRDVPLWLQAMDVFVHASRREPFGIVLIEAMALGKPTIAGRGAGPDEIVTDGVDGLLSPYGDSGVLAEAVLRYLDDPKYAEAVGRRARRRAQEFSVERYAERLCDVLHEAIRRNARPGAGTR